MLDKSWLVHNKTLIKNLLRQAHRTRAFLFSWDLKTCQLLSSYESKKRYLPLPPSFLQVGPVPSLSSESRNRRYYISIDRRSRRSFTRSTPGSLGSQLVSCSLLHWLNILRKWSVWAYDIKCSGDQLACAALGIFYSISFPVFLLS